ncbi:MAG: hypothetical protein ABIJ12_07205 [bacterium]
MLIRIFLKSLFIIIVINGISYCNDQISYDIIDDQLQKLTDTKMYDEIIRLLDSVGADYPEFNFEISDWYANTYLANRQYEKAYETWEKGHQKGYFYFLHPQIPLFKEIAETEIFKKLSEIDLQLRDEEMKQSKSIKEILIPQGYNPQKEYPLLVVLHGGGSSIKQSKRHWRSDRLNNEIVVLFIQSYRHYNSKKFGWRGGDQRARTDIKALFEETILEYNIDTTQVIIGGVSAGGVMAIDVAISDVIPLAGFLGVCPGDPPDLNIETATQMKELNLKGYIIAGETDFYRERQNKIMKIFDEAGFPYEFHEIKGLGHGYPDNFESWIDKGLEYLLSD